MIRRLVSALTFASVLATVAAQDPSWVAKVDALVAARVAKADAVGFSVGVAQKGEVLLAKGYGLADAEWRIPATADTRFRIGSVTKQFTAALVMRLVEQKKIALDDGLEKYVPEFPLQGKKVTVQMLLDHTSGIPNYTDIGKEWEKVVPLELTHGELLALVDGKPFDFEPGTEWRYDNTGYYLLGMVLEKVHGKSYADVVRDELSGPLGLADTMYGHNQDVIERRAHGYTMRAGKRVNADHLGMTQPGAAGALLSTGADLVRWSMALAGGKVVSTTSYERMTQATVLPNGRDTGYGFGLMRNEVLGRPAIFHGGGIHGFNSMLLHLPGDDLHVAVIGNAEAASSEKLAHEVVQAVLGIEKFVAKDEPLPADLRDRLAGEYDLADVGMALVVTAEGDRLRAKGKAPGQEVFGLLYQGSLEFRASFDHEVRIVFSADGKELTLHQNGGAFVGHRQ
ncbi:MAG: beta-lactamase family protein [Planctomycetes bacterium]|nr:beta-lactamase family protein [Planctomycetota bacterium]